MEIHFQIEIKKNIATHGASKDFIFLAPIFPSL